MTPRPLILLTNDDGIHSPGLMAAIEAVHDLADLVVVAPKEQQSAMGRSLPGSMSGAIFVEELRLNGDHVPAYSVPGSPAQAVLYGLHEVCRPRRPDLVISGINYGENLGTSVMVSGTVGAALQAADMGVPALAISLETDPAYHARLGYDVDWRAAVHFTRWLTRLALAQPFPPDVDVLKMDIPAAATPQTPWRLTRQSRLPYYETIPSDRLRFEDEVRLPYQIMVDRSRLEPDSDIYAFAVDHVVPVTPLSLDMSSRTPLSQLAAQLGT